MSARPAVLPVASVLLAAAPLAFVLGSCTGELDDRGPPPGVPVAEWLQAVAPSTSPVVRPSPELTPAADPKLEGFDGFLLAFDAWFHRQDGRACAIVVSRDGAELARLPGAPSDAGCAAVWDGLDPAGGYLAPGPVDVAAVVTSEAGDELARAEASVEIVRLGLGEIQATAAAGRRVPLLYRKTDGVRQGFHELPVTLAPFRLGPDASEPAAAVDLEDASGLPRALPAPWDDVQSPPIDRASPDDVERDTFNLPTAFVAGSTVTFAATLSASVAGAEGGGAPAVAEVRVLAPAGTTLEGPSAFEHGATVSVTTDASPVPAVGRWDLALEWRFEARAPGGEWQPVPGSLTTTHRVYGLVAAPIFDFPDLPHRAWVDVVDRVAGWVDGASAGPDEVAGRIVEGVYFELGLTYDRERGASHYTEYTSGFGGAIFSASWFEDRAVGSTINCSDAASVVSAYANMMGIDLRYHILQHRFATGFDLNYIQAIGSTAFTETPFTSGRGAFRYHAVVGPPDGRFFDATLALDGDGTPTALPSTLLLARGLTDVAYKRALSSEWMDVVTSRDEKVRIR